MDKLIRDGSLCDVSASIAAIHFKALCCSDIIERQLWGLGSMPDAAQQQSIIASAVNVFLDSYAMH